MCFIPLVSLGTFFIEFVIATFILYYFKKSNFRNTSSIFVYFLGFYQLSEYFLCTSSIPQTWGRIAVVTYTFLPALALKMTLEYLNHSSTKSLNFKIFIIPFIISMITIFKENFITYASCEKYFVTIMYQFSSSYDLLIQTFYFAYYFGFILIIFYLLHTSHKKKRDAIEWFYLMYLIGLVPALLFLFILPRFYLWFPSVYCHFSILSTLCLLRIFFLMKKQNFK